MPQHQAVAGPSRRKTRSQQRKTRTDLTADATVIALTDSDDDEPQPKRKRKKTGTKVDSAAAIPRLANVSAGISGPSHAVVEEHPPTNNGLQHDALVELGNILPDIFADIPAAQREESAVPNERLPGLRLDDYLSQVLEVVPDVDPEHAAALISQHMEAYAAGVVEAVIGIMLEESYSKTVRGKGKRKRDDADDPVVRQAPEFDYGKKDRAHQGGLHYPRIAENQLCRDFPYIPKPFVHSTLMANNYLYAPTYYELRQHLKQAVLPFKKKIVPTAIRDKGKFYDAEFERELAWLQKKLQVETEPPVEDHVSEDEECEDGIECACCFSRYSFEKIVQCPEAHLFCRSCVTRYAQTQLGSHDPNIACMHSSECKLPFHETELARFLPAKLLDLYHRVKQQKEIQDAQIDGLEECPFCEFKAVIENAEEKLFRCQRDDCSAISCRNCKKLDHLPLSCEEAEEDKSLNARHRVEEAMSDALMRKCPNAKCKKPFIKESGCNKIVCTHCRTISCYICRQIIKDYSHFNRGDGQTASSTKCLLWDTPGREHQEVADARDRAVDNVQRENPEVERQQLQVELPEADNPARANIAGALLDRHPVPNPDYPIINYIEQIIHHGERVVRALPVGDQPLPPHIRFAPPIVAGNPGVPYVQQQPGHARGPLRQGQHVVGQAAPAAPLPDGLFRVPPPAFGGPAPAAAAAAAVPNFFFPGVQIDVLEAQLRANGWQRNAAAAPQPAPVRPPANGPLIDAVMQGHPEAMQARRPFPMQARRAFPMPALPPGVVAGAPPRQPRYGLRERAFGPPAAAAAVPAPLLRRLTVQPDRRLNANVLAVPAPAQVLRAPRLGHRN